MNSKFSFCFFSNLFTFRVRSWTLFFKVVGEVDCLALNLACPLTLDLLLLSLLNLLLGLGTGLLLDVLLPDPLTPDLLLLSLLDPLLGFGPGLLLDVLLLDLLALGLGLLDLTLSLDLALDREEDLEILLLRPAETVLGLLEEDLEILLLRLAGTVLGLLVLTFSLEEALLLVLDLEEDLEILLLCAAVTALCSASSLDLGLLLDTDLESLTQFLSPSLPRCR